MIVSPSLLSADFFHLDREIAMINRSAAQWLHLDVMDGVFCPNISFGFPVIKRVANHCTKLLDAHFMIVRPERYVAKAAELNIRMLTVHAEACDDMHSVIEMIHSYGMLAGIALRPGTPLTAIADVLTEADMFLPMSVNPGFSGQHFIDSTMGKIQELKALLMSVGSKAMIEVDGGVDAHNVHALRAAGVDVVVCGNYVFKADNPEDIIQSIVNIA